MNKEMYIKQVVLIWGFITIFNSYNPNQGDTKMKKTPSFNVLHICDYAAYYRGNFIDSLESLEKYHDNVKNFYLFPARAQHTVAKEWIDALNESQEVAYFQKENTVSNILLLLNIIRKNKINRIVRHFSDKKMDILVRLFFNGKKVVRFFHNDCEPASTTVKQKIKEFLYKGNKLVGVSDAIASHIKAVFPTYSVYSLVNAIYFDRLDNIDEVQHPDGISLLIMGWDYKRKGVDLAIKATHALQKKYNLTLQILGGVNEDKIKRLANEILGKDVDWIRYLPPTNNVGTYYTKNDIFLSPSRQEAFGYANIEAAYCKNSIVLSKVDGQGELQIDGAYWFESDNIEEFTQKLEQAIIELNLPEKVTQREFVKTQVQQIYSLQEWSNKLVDIF